MDFSLELTAGEEAFAAEAHSVAGGRLSEFHPCSVPHAHHRLTANLTAKGKDSRR